VIRFRRRCRKDGSITARTGTLGVHRLLLQRGGGTLNVLRLQTPQFWFGVWKCWTTLNALESRTLSQLPSRVEESPVWTHLGAIYSTASAATAATLSLSDLNILSGIECDSRSFRSRYCIDLGPSAMLLS